MTSAGLRRTLRWPIWSWRNLTITTVVALAVLAGVGQLTTHPGSRATAAETPTTVSPGPRMPPTTVTTTAPDPTETETGTATAGSKASATVPPPTMTAGAIPSAASPVEVATAFANAWTHTSGGESAWLADMSRWATARLVDSLRGTDPTQVPATRVTGDAALVSRTDKTAAVSVPTDGGRIAVTLTAAGGTWKADALAPDDAPPAAATPDLEPAPTTPGG